MPESSDRPVTDLEPPTPADWRDVACTCGLAVKGIHHSTECERAMARALQRQVRLSRAAARRGKR